ncbi:MAG: ParB-like nuclease domain-containing protein [Acidobacteria bacterium]|nr:ParB-like nuclease domain-containing protein [Acidobacteriota bacterium]
MICKEISIEEIDLTNETFRISEEIVSAPLRMSMREVGQLNPVLLLEGKHTYRLICGFRRLYALRQLSASHVFARIVEERDRDLSGIFNLAFWDNLSHRQLDPLEKARALYKLRNNFGVSNNVIIKNYLPLMDLSPHKQVLHIYNMMHTSNQGLRNRFKAGHLTLSSMEYLAAMPASSQASIASGLEGIRLSAGLQKKFFSLLRDLAAKNGIEPEVPFKDPEVLSILNDAGLSPFQRGEKVFALLYRWRYPRLTQAEERFFERKKSLELPGSIRIVPAPYFEVPDLRVEFNAPDAERFREMAAELFEASQTPELDGLFKVI